MTTIGNDDVHGTESTTDGVFVVLVDDDNVDTVGRRRRVDVGRLGEQHQNASGHRRGPVTYGSMVDGGDEEEVDDDDATTTTTIWGCCCPQKRSVDERREARERWRQSEWRLWRRAGAGGR
jgi:hypothetical protein